MHKSLYYVYVLPLWLEYGTFLIPLHFHAEYVRPTEESLPSTLSKT